MRKSAGPKLNRPTGLWILSLLVVASMICSLIVVLIPPREPQPTPEPTLALPSWTPTPEPTLTLASIVTPTLNTSTAQARLGPFATPAAPPAMPRTKLDN